MSVDRSETTAIILAAGEGIRLRPLTKYRPKPMLPAVTSPILEHVLDGVIDCGITDITIVVGHRHRRIQSYFGSQYCDVPLTYRAQSAQLGTGHALLAADPPRDRPFLVMYGDQIVGDALLDAVLDSHGDAPATVGVIPGLDVSEYGGAIVDDGRVVDLVDRPADDREYFLNAGVYLFEEPVLAAVERAERHDGDLSLIDGIARLLAAGDPVGAAVSDAFWADATYPWDLLDITRRLLARRSKDSIASTATVHPAATIREPVAIGSDVEIGPSAVIGPDTAIGENVTVGPGAVVEHSVIDTDTRIGANATLVDAVTGIGARIGAGSIIPGGPGDVRVDADVFVDAGLGALLADRAIDRGGVNYLPGTVIGADAEIGTGATVREPLPDGAILRA